MENQLNHLFQRTLIYPDNRDAEMQEETFQQCGQYGINQEIENSNNWDTAMPSKIMEHHFQGLDRYDKFEDFKQNSNDIGFQGNFHILLISFYMNKFDLHLLSILIYFFLDFFYFRC